ncbi:MAG: tetratricopeptide repeat protein [Chitinophagia bacterium]|jgi:tetratricopeptide (TPR) repeat protein
MERIEKIKQMLETLPNDAFLLHAFALESKKIGNLIAARDTFMRLLENQPDYVGSYYHLAATLQELNQTSEAIEWYEKGMNAAKKAGDTHTFNELRAAYDECIGL